jgi:hypothetical protein|tara:strand:- start:248 stop:562 length:315 start_codon:yes stop_codon:yes gene_type:complete
MAACRHASETHSARGYLHPTQILFSLNNLQAIRQINLVDALKCWIKSTTIFPSGPMKDGVAIVAAADQSEKRFGGGKMNLKFATVARDDRHFSPLFFTEFYQIA